MSEQQSGISPAQKQVTEEEQTTQKMTANLQTQYMHWHYPEFLSLMVFVQDILFFQSFYVIKLQIMSFVSLSDLHIILFLFQICNNIRKE